MKRCDLGDLMGESCRRQRTRWCLALSAVLVSHAAVGIALGYQSAHAPDVAAGAPIVIEIAEFAAAPATAASAPAAPPSPVETSQQEDIQKPEPEIPQSEPDIPEPAPQLVQEKPFDEDPEPQPTPVDLPKPKPKITLKKVAQEHPSAQKKEYPSREKSADTQQSESLATPTAATLAATSQSTNRQADNTGILTQKRATWEGRLAAHLERHKRYPYMARSRREEGTVVLRFIMNREGEIIESYVDQGSGSFLLDREVEDMLRRAKPLPPPPDDVAGNRLELVLPIQFALR